MNRLNSNILKKNNYKNIQETNISYMKFFIIVIFMRYSSISITKQTQL